MTARDRRATLGRMNKRCMLPSFVVSLVLLAITPALRAQTAQGIEKAETVAHELKLTPQQEAKVISNPQARGSQNSADKKQSFNVRNAEDERAAGDP